MSARTKKRSGQQTWIELGELFKQLLPHLNSVLTAEEDFVELRLKARPDGTTLAILKKYDLDGGPVVAFGSGYGVYGSLLAVNSTVNSGNWKVDKPYRPNTD